MKTFSIYDNIAPLFVVLNNDHRPAAEMVGSAEAEVVGAVAAGGDNVPK